MDTISSYNRRYSLIGYILLLLLLLPPLALLILNGYEAIPSLVTDIGFLKQTGLVMATAATCTLAALIVALPGIVIYSRCRTSVRNLLRVLLAFGFCFPPLVMNMGFDCLFSEGGFIKHLELDPAIRSGVISLMLNIPVFIVMVGEHWRLLGPEDAQSARSLGSSRLRIFLRITLPKIMPALAGSVALVFLRNMVGIKNEIIALIPAIIVLIVLVVSDGKRSRTELASVSPGSCFSLRNAFTAFLSFIYMTAAVVMLLGPAVALALRSILAGGEISFKVYTTLFSVLNLDFLVGLAFCVGSALVAALISSFISLHICVGIASEDSGIFLVMFPLAAGPAALALGFRALFMWIPETVVTRMVLATVCFTVLMIPVQTMVMLPSLRRVPQTLRSTSMSLGFSNGRSFRRIELRLIGADIRSAICTSIALGISGYGAAESFGLNTVFAQTVRFWDKGDTQTACAMATVMLVLCFIFFTLGVGHTREVNRYV